MNDPKIISWTELANETYLNLLTYLIDNFGLLVAKKYENEVSQLLNQIQFFNKMCPQSNKNKNYFKCVINKQSSIVYKIENNIIELIAFIDNRSDHQY
jgi:plasmid stabilization system protein ParE